MASTNDPHAYELREAELQRQEQRAERWERTAPPVESERVWCVTAKHKSGKRIEVFGPCIRPAAIAWRGIMASILPEWAELRVERQAETREAGETSHTEQGPCREQS